MKNLLILALLSVFLSADNNKTMSKQEFLKQMRELDEKEEKTDKFIQKLEEMKKKLEQEKLEMKQKENPK